MVKCRLFTGVLTGAWARGLASLPGKDLFLVGAGTFFKPLGAKACLFDFFFGPQGLVELYGLGSHATPG